MKLLVAGLALGLPLLALSSAQAPLTEGARVVFESASGELREESVAGMQLSDPRQAGAHLVRFEGLVAGRPLSGAVARFDLAGGDRLYASPRGGEGEVLTLGLVGGVKLSLPIDALRGLRFEERMPPGWSERVSAADEGDRLYLEKRTGLDRVDGTLLEFRDDGVLFEGAIGEKLFAWSEIAALFVEALADEEFGGDALDNVPVVCDLVDRSRLTGFLSSVDENTCRLRVRGAALELPLWTVAELFVDDGTCAFLSDRKPDGVDEASPFGDDLGMSWPHQIDRSVSGAPLMAGGRTYTRGIGVHAPSRLTWELDGEWKRLRGAVALDDQVQRLPARGSIVFRVLGDGKALWESPLVRGGDRPVTLPAIPLAGVRELVLEADMATEFYAADRGDWLRILLER